MKLAFFAVVSLLFAGQVALAQNQPAPAAAGPELKTVQQQASYAIGRQIGETLKARAYDVDVNLLARGIFEVLSGGKSRLSDEEIEAAMTAFQRESAAKAEEQARLAGEKNKQVGAAFLAANKQQQGVFSTPSGLQYKVIKQGTGKVSPKPTDTVTTHYKGTLIDGTEFDSSYGGKPVSFPVNGVIAGWTEALQLMKVGDKWQLFIPSGLAYKERGAGGRIGPNETLIFEVELLAIEPASEPLPGR